ncbi:hypothetical protein [Thermocatellispora tengchongensis]
MERGPAAGGFPDRGPEPVMHFADAAGWEAWLAAHHADGAAPG